MFFKKKKKLEKNITKELHKDLWRGFKKMNELLEGIKEEIKVEKGWKELKKFYKELLEETKAQEIRVQQYIEKIERLHEDIESDKKDRLVKRKKVEKKWKEVKEFYKELLEKTKAQKIALQQYIEEEEEELKKSEFKKYSLQSMFR